eukprot:gene18828-19143_t
MKNFTCPAANVWPSTRPRHQIEQIEQIDQIIGSSKSEGTGKWRLVTMSPGSCPRRKTTLRLANPIHSQGSVRRLPFRTQPSSHPAARPSFRMIIVSPFSPNCLTMIRMTEPSMTDRQNKCSSYKAPRPSRLTNWISIAIFNSYILGHIRLRVRIPTMPVGYSDLIPATIPI